MTKHLTACPPHCTCHGSFSQEDEQFLKTCYIVLDKPEPLPRIPVLATAFYAALFTGVFYAALWLWLAL